MTSGNTAQGILLLPNYKENTKLKTTENLMVTNEDKITRKTQ
jgi:hypothetical protein